MRVEGAHAAHAVLDLGNDLRLAVRLLNPKVGPQLIHHGQERDRLPKGQALALQPGHRFPGCSQGATAFQHEARLANAGFTSDGDHLPMARFRLLEQVQQHRQLAVTSDARREPPLGRHLQAGAPPTRPQHGIDAHGLRMALDGVLPQVTRLEKARHQLVRGLTDDHRARLASCCSRAARLVVSPTAV